MDWIGGEADSAVRGVGQHRLGNLLAQRATCRETRHFGAARGTECLELDHQSMLFSTNLDGSHPKSFEASGLHPDRFDHLHVFGGEGELFSLEIFFHMLRVRSTG